jgi:Fic family protein
MTTSAIASLKSVQETLTQLDTVLRASVKYRLRPTEVLLLLILLRDIKFSGKVDLAEWARALGMEPHKLRKDWQELQRLGIASENVDEGTFEVQTDPLKWSVQLRARP